MKTIIAFLLAVILVVLTSANPAMEKSDNTVSIFYDSIIELLFILDTVILCVGLSGNIETKPQGMVCSRQVLRQSLQPLAFDFVIYFVKFHIFLDAFYIQGTTDNFDDQITLNAMVYMN